MQAPYVSLKDKCILLGAVALWAPLAWVLWHYTEAGVFSIFIIHAVIGVVLDNRRLRARLRAYQGPH
jgi:hypothetical protein